MYSNEFKAVHMLPCTVRKANALDLVKKNTSGCLLFGANVKRFLSFCCQIDPKPCTPRGMQPEKSRTKEGWVRGN